MPDEKRASKLSYSVGEAAQATGLSVDTIKKAIRAGDLPVKNPRVDGRPIGKYVILAADLQAWLDSPAA